MTRETSLSHKIAILATGDEVIQGDIINSNGRDIAQRLIKAGMQIRMHVMCPDNISEIEQAIHFLLNHHQAVILTGGLGPTSDDLTRYALSNALNKPLIFNEEAWQAICERLQRFGYTIPPENNRQQALFPEGAEIIPNSNGTAAGCLIRHQDKIIFMLPGPPNECLTMMDTVVVDYLKKENFSQIVYADHWFLLGVSEGKIAEEIDNLVKDLNCITGYRLCYPYLECKIKSSDKKDFERAEKLISDALAPYYIADGKEIASDILKKKITQEKCFLVISDFVTGGLLEATLKTPETYTYLTFTQNVGDVSNVQVHFTIRGLDEYWEQNFERSLSKIAITCVKESDEITEHFEIPCRDNRARLFALEFICSALFRKLRPAA